MNRNQLASFLKYVRVNEATGCWEWIGTLKPEGYPQLWANGRHEAAHRLAYEHYVGLIAPRMQIDHTCLVKHCVYYEHLKQVTNCENHNLAVQRKENFNSAKMHCKRGHAFTEENTYFYQNIAGMTSRTCRICRRLNRQPGGL